MDAARTKELFRAVVKQKLREKGLKFDGQNFTLRQAKRETKHMSKELKLTSPITVVELLELYLELMVELTNEHFAMVERKLAKVKAKAAKKAGTPKK